MAQHVVQGAVLFWYNPDSMEKSITKAKLYQLRPAVPNRI
jgi:hypothetical protein